MIILPRLSSTRFRSIALAAAGALLALAGCSGGDIGVNIQRPAGDRPDVDVAAVAQGAIRLPADAEFNVRSFQSDQTLDARGRASVAKDSASCGAEARDEGSASGEFQLGYVFDNATGGPLDAVVRLRLSFTETLASQGVDAATGRNASAGNAVLAFLIKDTNGLVVKREDLAVSASETGPGASGGARDLAFDVRFEADRGYYLFLHGRADSTAKAKDCSASASIDVRDCALEIQWNPAREAAAATPATGEALGTAP